MLNKFNYKKQKLLNLLEIISNKLLFPASLIESLKKKAGLDIFSGFIKEYNLNIIKARKFIFKLNLINSWGIFFNSYFYWKNSISVIIYNNNIYVEEILKYIKESSLESNKKKLLTQSNINIQKFTLFFTISKEFSNYVSTSMNSDGMYSHYTLTKEQIEKLFPLCIDLLELQSDNNIFNSYEKPHQLDISDNFI